MLSVIHTHQRTTDTQNTKKKKKKENMDMRLVLRTWSCPAAIGSGTEEKLTEKKIYNNKSRPVPLLHSI